MHPEEDLVAEAHKCEPMNPCRNELVEWVMPGDLVPGGGIIYR